jgi:hypothetical protein
VHLPVERILCRFGLAHAEGLAEPKDFIKGLVSFSPEAQRRIMGENARELTLR